MQRNFQSSTAVCRLGRRDGSGEGGIRKFAPTHPDTFADSAAQADSGMLGGRAVATAGVQRHLLATGASAQFVEKTKLIVESSVKAAAIVFNRRVICDAYMTAQYSRKPNTHSQNQRAS